MNIQLLGRRGLNPSLAGRPEGGPSPPRAGTGYAPGRRGEGKPGATAPRPTAGSGLSRPRCGAATAVGSPLPSSQEPEAPRVLNPGIRNFCTASVETSESRCPAPGLEALRYPAPPPGGAGGPRHQSPEGPWRPSVPQPCLEDSGPGTTDSLQQSPGARAQDLWVGGTWGRALQSPSAALWGCSIHHFEGTLEVGSPTLPPLV